MCSCLLNGLLKHNQFQMTNDREPVNFTQMVDAAVLRLVGLPDDQVVERLMEIVTAYEQALNDSWPEMSATDLQILREHFLAEIGQRLKYLSGSVAPGKA